MILQSEYKILYPHLFDVNALSPKQIQLLRDYVQAKRDFVRAEAFKKDNRIAVLKILEMRGGTEEIDGGVLYASESIAISKSGEKRVYRCVKFEDRLVKFTFD